jgi:TonB family protein
MREFIIHIIQSSLILTVFIIFYELFLRNERAFLKNRIYLISTLILSIVIPLFSFNLTVLPVNIRPITILDQIIISPSENKPEQLELFQLSNIILYIYRIITTLIFLNILKGFVQLYFIYRKSAKEQYKNYTIVYIEKKISPFSIFNIIFLNRTNLSSTEINTIIEHEKIHAKQKHSTDILISEVILILMWFNPAIYYYKKLLRENHEYLVDNRLIMKEKDISEYINLIVKQAERAHFGFANQFNNSLTIKRLIMMKNYGKKTYASYKFWLVIPLIIGVFSVFSCKNKDVTKEIEKTVIISSDKDSTINKEEMDGPKFPGGESAMLTYIATNVKYPENARKNGLQDKVFVQFNVSKEGKLSDFKIKQGKYEELNNEAIRVIKSMPDWEPSKLDGKEQKFEYVFPIWFKLEDEKKEK